MASSKRRGFQKLSPPKGGVTPPQPPSLENISSLLHTNPPQNGQKQLQRAVPIAHLPPSLDSRTSFVDVGVSTTGTNPHIPWVCESINETRSTDWCSGNITLDVDSTVALAAIGNEDDGMWGSPEEQMTPLSLMATTTSTDGLERSDSGIFIDAIEAILGDSWQDEMVACDNSYMANQS